MGLGSSQGVNQRILKKMIWNLFNIKSAKGVEAYLISLPTTYKVRMLWNKNLRTDALGS